MIGQAAAKLGPAREIQSGARGGEGGGGLEAAELEDAGEVEAGRDGLRAVAVVEAAEVDRRPRQPLEGRAGQQGERAGPAVATRLTSRMSGSDRAQARTVARSCAWSAARVGL